MITQKSFILKPLDHTSKWHLIDAKDQIVGRLASKIANILRGKHSPSYTPNADSGDFVVVINASKVKFTGKKWKDKKYYRHSGYTGGLKCRTAQEQLESNPELILKIAVDGMMPEGSLARKQMTKLRIFSGSNHTHESQKPVKLEV